MARPSRRGRSRPLTSTEESTGVVDGDAIDWPTSPSVDVEAIDKWKQPVRVATTATLTIATGLNVGDTVDGVTLAEGDRVLVKDQSAPELNGIYVAGSAPERAADFDDAGDVLGSLVYVIDGTANGGTVFYVDLTDVPVMETDPITFAELAGSSTSFGTPAVTYGTPAAGAASTAIRTDAVLVPPNKVELSLVNKSGGSVAAGDVVRVDTANDGAFTTTTTAQIETSVGIAQETIANNATGRVLVSGFAALVNVPASVTRGHYVETHTVAKQATGSATRRAGSFGQFLTGGTTPSAILWGQTDQTASGGSGDVATDTIWNAKGDLAVGTGSDTAARLAVGSNGQVLTADSGETTGAKWATPSGGASDVVNVASGAGSVTVPGIAIADRVPSSPSAYDDEFDTTDTSDPLTGWTTLGSSFDALNMNSDALSHLHMAKNSPGTFQVYGIYKAIPSMPFTVTAKFTAIRGLGTLYARAGIMLLETGPGKINAHGLHNTSTAAAGGGFNMGNEAWNSRTSRASFTDRGTGAWPPIYLRMVVTSSSSVANYWSYDGLEWYAVVTGINPGFTIAYVGLYITGEDNNTACGTYVDWIRFT